MNDVNYIVNYINSSLRLYADYTTQYASDTSPVVLEYTIDKDMHMLSVWFKANYLQINGGKTQAMMMGKSNYS